MKSYQKIAFVLLGYAAAWMIAVSMADAFDAKISAADPANAGGGMAAFGVMLYFLWVFGVLAMMPTALAIWFLRPHHRAWEAGVKVSRFAAATAVAALIASVPFLWWARDAAMSKQIWVLLGLLAVGVRLVGSLACGAVDLVALLFAPKAEYRVKFFWTGVIEGLAFAGGYALFLFWGYHR